MNRRSSIASFNHERSPRPWKVRARRYHPAEVPRDTDRINRAPARSPSRGRFRSARCRLEAMAHPVAGDDPGVVDQPPRASGSIRSRPAVIAASNTPRARSCVRAAGCGRRGRNAGRSPPWRCRRGRRSGSARSGRTTPADRPAALPARPDPPASGRRPPRPPPRIADIASTKPLLRGKVVLKVPFADSRRRGDLRRGDPPQARVLNSVKLTARMRSRVLARLDGGKRFRVR